MTTNVGERRPDANVSPHRSRGSSASRRPSPTRLNDSTTRKIASPGQTAIQGALVRKRCAALSMLPQDGAGGCWPRPRKDSAASAMIAAARSEEHTSELQSHVNLVCRLLLEKK